MSTQELGMASARLGHHAAARRLVERVYLGYQNLKPRDDKMAFVTLQNLAFIYTPP